MVKEGVSINSVERNMNLSRTLKRKGIWLIQVEAWLMKFYLFIMYLNIMKNGY